MDNLDKLVQAIQQVTVAALMFETYEAEYIGDDFSLTVRTSKGYSDEE